MNFEYSREGGILGVACILETDEEVCLGQRMMLFRPNPHIKMKFVCYYLNSPLLLEHVDSLIGGSAAPHINISDIKAFPIPIPSYEEQNEIVSRIEKYFELANKIESRYLKSKSMFDNLPSAILTKAFRGELVPQDPDDEPASVLLERIKNDIMKSGAEVKNRRKRALT